MTTAATSTQKLRGTSRDQIIDVSLTIIEGEGVEQLTIRRIAETINRTQPAVYQHFSSKDAILAAVVIEGFTALVERLKHARDGGQRRSLRSPMPMFVLDWNGRDFTTSCSWARRSLHSP